MQMQNLTGRHPLKSDHNEIIIAKNNVNSYSVKVHGSNLVTVRNGASLRKILPVVPVHKVVFGQGPVQEAQGADSAGGQQDRAGQLTGLKQFGDRAGLRAGVKSRLNVDKVGRQAGAGAGAGPRVEARRNVGQSETGLAADADNAESVLRAGAELANPGLLGVLRAMPRLHGADSGFSTGQGKGRSDPSHSRVMCLFEGGPAAAAATGSPGPRGTGRYRSGVDSPQLGSSSPVQGDIEGVH